MSQDDGMQRVLGIGGYFVKSADPVALLAWYREALGLDLGEYGQWDPEAGPTVVAAFTPDDASFGPGPQETMVNFRVADLDAMLAQVRAYGGTVEDERQDMEGVGRFGWVVDPEGRRIELWEPS